MLCSHWATLRYQSTNVMQNTHPEVWSFDAVFINMFRKFSLMEKLKNLPINCPMIIVYFSLHKSKNLLEWMCDQHEALLKVTPESHSLYFFDWDHLHSKLPAVAFKAGWARVAKLLLSLTLKQGNDTNITQNAITPHPVLFETQWSVKVNEGKCSVKPVRLHGLG